MNTPMRPSPRHVPTLTEVIDLQEGLGGAGAPAEVVPPLAVPSVELSEPHTEADAVVVDTWPDALAEPPADPFVAVPPVVPPEPLASAVAPVPALAPAEAPQNLQDAPIPRAMLVDRGTERPGFARTVPADLPPLASTVGAAVGRAFTPSHAPTAPTSRLPEATAVPSAAALEAQITQRVMADLQRQIDGMLEYRLRETLAPILARTSEALVRELRQELSKTMKDVVARSVAQEVARQRSRG